MLKEEKFCVKMSMGRVELIIAVRRNAGADKKAFAQCDFDVFCIEKVGLL